MASACNRFISRTAMSSLKSAIKSRSPSLEGLAASSSSRMPSSSNTASTSPRRRFSSLSRKLSRSFTGAFSSSRHMIFSMLERTNMALRGHGNWAWVISSKVIHSGRSAMTTSSGHQAPK